MEPPTETTTRANRLEESPTTDRTPAEQVRQSPVGDADTYDVRTTSEIGGGSLAVRIFAAAAGLVALLVVLYLFLA